MAGNGYNAKRLGIDLNIATNADHEISGQGLRDFVGGRGLGIRLLFEIAPKGVDPLAPENPLILAVAPYTGAGVFFAFFKVTAKAPLTGLAAVSHCGGHRCPALKKSKFTDEQITFALRQAETGTWVAEVCSKMGISEATFCNWKIEIWRPWGSRGAPPEAVGRGKPASEAHGG